MKHQFNSTLNDFETRLQEKDREIALAQKSYDELAAKMNAVTSEKSSLLSQLEDARERLKTEEKRADRLVSAVLFVILFDCTIKQG